MTTLITDLGALTTDTPAERVRELVDKVWFERNYCGQGLVNIDRKNAFHDKIYGTELFDLFYAKQQAFLNGPRPKLVGLSAWLALSKHKQPHNLATALTIANLKRLEQ